MLKQALLLSCEHGGNRVPPAYQHLFQGQAELLASHRGYDLGALSLGQALSKELSAPLLTTDITRLLVDTNRCRTSRSLFSEPVRRLPATTKELLLEHYHQPHRAEVETKVAALIAAGKQVVHLSVHSFTPVLNGEVRNTDLGLLYDPGRDTENRFCQSWKSLLLQEQPEIRVRMNYPYRGTADSLTRELRKRFMRQSYLGIELEINQGLLNSIGEFPVFWETSLVRSLRQLIQD